MKSWVYDPMRQRQQALADLGLRALADIELGTLLEEAAVVIARAMDVEHVDLLGWTPDNDALVLRASVGWDELRGSRRAAVERMGSMLAQIASAPRAVRLDDLRREPSLWPDRVRETGLRTLVAAPMWGGGRSQGVLAAYANRRFDPDDAAFMEQAAALLGAAIDQRHRHARQQRSEARLRELLAETPDALLTVDADGRVIAFNAAAETLTGRPSYEVLDHPLAAILPELVPLLGDHEVDEIDECEELAITSSDGNTRWVEPRSKRCLLSDGAPVVQILLRDITRRREAERARAELEQHLAQVRRLEAVGRLASGVAHDFNNVLTVILTTASLALREGPLTGQQREDLEAIYDAADRASSLTRQLLAFSRDQPAPAGVLSVSQVLRELDEMLRRLLGENIAFRVHTEDGTTVHADSSQIEQIVLNLVLNARDALPSGGHIDVEARRVVLGMGEVDEVPAGEWVRLRVVDDGIGMDEETLPRIFEPFFSRKSRDRGTGLGLSTVQAIVERSRGYVVVQSEPREGSRFDIYLPLARPAETLSRVEPQRPLTGSMGETILLVEDQAPLLHATARLLESAGYVVLTATDVERALETWRRHPHIDILVTDVVLPRHSGVELLRILREQRPLLPAVLVSGFADDVLANEPVPPDAVVLDKPFLADELLDAVREVLDVEGTLDTPLRPEQTRNQHGLL